MGLSDVGDQLPGLEGAQRVGNRHGIKTVNAPKRVYVASSWRNPVHIAVCASLKAAGIDHYDFKNPEDGVEGFHWGEVGMASYVRSTNNAVPVDEYLAGIVHPIAEEGFARDFGAMQECDACVLVLPAGRSANLELGWFVGQGKRTAVLCEDPMVPDLMYKMVDYIAPSLFDLLGWLGVQD